jgi:hypothetical protein
LGCRDGAPKIVTKMGKRLQRPNSGKRVAGNPRKNALSGVVPETCGLRRLDGGGASPAKPVSDAEFPANRVITGNFSEFGLREVLVGRRNKLAAAVSARLPAQNLTAKIFWGIRETLCYEQGRLRIKQVQLFYTEVLTTVLGIYRERSRTGPVPWQLIRRVCLLIQTFASASLMRKITGSPGSKSPGNCLRSWSSRRAALLFLLSAML